MQAEYSYLTLDNGGHPFRVAVTEGNKVTVWSYNHKRVPNRPYLSFRTSRIFIGKSPKNAMTDFSGGYGREYDGNSVILQKIGDESQNIYYYVGSEIYKFQASAPIIYYQSPVGNSSVPYPWAQDALGNIYLMAENIQFPAGDKLNPNAPESTKDLFEPYNIYYDKKFSFSFEAVHPVSKKSYKFEWTKPSNIDHVYNWYVSNRQDFLNRLSQKPDSRSLSDIVEHGTAAIELGKEVWALTIKYHGDHYGLKGLSILEEISGRTI